MQKESRLTSRKDYQEVYRHGRSVANKYLVVYFLDRKTTGVRVGVSVSRKIGSAVVRNRIKRLLKEIFRKNKEAIKQGYDVVFIARQPIKEKSFHDTEKAFLDVLQKAGLIEKVDENNRNRVN